MTLLKFIAGSYGMIVVCSIVGVVVMIYGAW